MVTGGQTASVRTPMPSAKRQAAFARVPSKGVGIHSKWASLGVLSRWWVGQAMHEDRLAGRMTVTDSLSLSITCQVIVAASQ